jgi:hypothetical protein
VLRLEDGLEQNQVFTKLLKNKKTKDQSDSLEVDARSGMSFSISSVV